VDLIEARERGGDVGVRHPWEAARVEVVRGLVIRHVGLPAGADVIDIGCGDTFVVDVLAGACPEARFSAVDTAFSSQVIDYYRRRLHRPNVRLFPSLEAIEPKPSQVRLVLLLDVIEHIEQDVAFLGNLRAQPYVTRETRLLITVPAFQSLYSSHDTFLGHFRRYSRSQLQRHVERAGYRVLESGYFFASLLPVRAAQAIAERWRGAGRKGTTGLVAWRGGPAKAAVLTTALLWDARMALALNRVGIMLPGLSTYAICATSV